MHFFGCLQVFWISQIIYVCIQFLSKLSILLLYLRIFWEVKWMRRVCFGAIVVLCSHSIPIFVVSFAQCRPLEAIWDRSITTGQCLDVGTIAFIGGALSIAWDVFLIALPLHEVLKLQATLRDRLIVILAFGVLSVASVTSITRLLYITEFNNSLDPTCEYQIYIQAKNHANSEGRGQR